jgi:hypothetical protein
MSLTEQRYRPRFPYHARGILILLPRIVEVTLLDMSSSGAHVFLNQACDVQMGQYGSLRILNCAGRQVLEVDASVHWNSANHLGLALANMTPGIERALRTMVAMNLGTESLLKRDLSALLHPFRSRESTTA